MFQFEHSNTDNFSQGQFNAQCVSNFITKQPNNSTGCMLKKCNNVFFYLVGGRGGSQTFITTNVSCVQWSFVSFILFFDITWGQS